MIEATYVLKWLHVIGAAVLLGTGAGIAFFMLMAHRTGRAEVIAAVGRIVITADFLFTLTAVIAQPVTGLMLVIRTGYELTDLWIWLSIALYVFTGLFWIPVIFIQMKMTRLAEAAEAAGTALGPDYHRLYRAWFLCGWPAFGAVLAIFWLMITKPILF